ncbi:hypothetical protein [Nodosilinea nodulosa]|uniref:hypothetical protein n=1 Tax=Nodosilinea nodulosa TaxID=416001 RepID=UPI0008FB6CAD|nr:hypothetical protein [Nodosilinea nodulosa]
MVKLGWAVTIYIFVSFFLFLMTSFTSLGWIVYGLIILPIYAAILLVWWLMVWQNPTKGVRIRYWIWSIVLVLQVSTILASPGNCYGWTQGANCYSNLQIFLGDVPRSGSSNIPHWKPLENNFPVLALAYGVSLVVALSFIIIKKTDSTTTST